MRLLKKLFGHDDNADLHQRDLDGGDIPAAPIHPVPPAPPTEVERKPSPVFMSTVKMRDGTIRRIKNWGFSTKGGVVSIDLEDADNPRQLVVNAPDWISIEDDMDE